MAIDQTTGSTGSKRSNASKSDYSAGKSSNVNLGDTSGSASSMIPNGLKDTFSGVSENFSGQIDRVTTFIKGKPMATFAAALGVGFLVGTLILRNKNRVGSSAGYDAGSI